MSNILSQASKISALTCIAAAMIMLSGVQSVMASDVGVNAAPPVISYSTTDPELQSYLTLVTSLENDLQGVLGKERSPKENEARLKLVEANMRKNSPKSMPGTTASQLLSIVEKSIDDEKARPAPRALSVLPVGADAKESGGRVYLTPHMFNERVESKTVSVTVVYHFSSVQEMSEKAHALGAKFAPVFSTEQGWKTLDLISQAQEQFKKIDAIEDPDLRQQLKVLNESNSKKAEAGHYWTTYNWASDQRAKIGTIEINIQNFTMIQIMPDLDAHDGQYTLLVMLTRSTAQPKNK